MFYQFEPDMKKENNKQHTDTGIQPNPQQHKEANFSQALLQKKKIFPVYYFM